MQWKPHYSEGQIYEPRWSSSWPVEEKRNASTDLFLISQFITMWSYVPFNPTKVTYGNKDGFWNISSIIVVRVCSIWIIWRHCSHSRSLNKSRLTFVLWWGSSMNITKTFYRSSRLLASRNFVQLQWSGIHFRYKFSFWRCLRIRWILLRKSLFLFFHVFLNFLAK